MRKSIKSLIIASILLLSWHAAGPALADTDRHSPCDRVANAAKRACWNEAFDDYWIGRGNCANMPDSAERRECYRENWTELMEAMALCGEQHEAREEVCDGLGGGYYAPEIEPDNFTSVIDNPYRPVTIGLKLVYEGETEDGLERIEVYSTGETRMVMGVECLVVRDVVTIDGELIEDTDDWFAQDLDGNVWYFGEIARNYEDGYLTDLEGSWEAGKDGALPGILMPAAPPEEGVLFRQEFLLGDAEDMAEVISLDNSVDVPYGSFDDCLKSLEFTPLEPDAFEFKYYAPGIGLVLEEKPEDEEMVELVDILVMK